MNVTIHGPTVKEIREKSGHSQSSAAREAGISRKTLWRIESAPGAHNVIGAVAKSLAVAIGVPVEKLSAGPPGQQPSPRKQTAGPDEEA